MFLLLLSHTFSAVNNKKKDNFSSFPSPPKIIFPVLVCSFYQLKWSVLNSLPTQAIAASRWIVVYIRDYKSFCHSQTVINLTAYIGDFSTQ